MPRNWLKTLTTNIQYSGYNIQYTGYNIRDTIYGIQYTEYNIRDTIYGIQPHGRPDGRTARRPRQSANITCANIMKCKYYLCKYYVQILRANITCANITCANITVRAAFSLRCQGLFSSKKTPAYSKTVLDNINKL